MLSVKLLKKIGASMMVSSLLFLLNIHTTKPGWRQQMKYKKGVWQVMPVQEGWDHLDFIGLDTNDTSRSQDELKNFWHSIAEDLVKSEETTK